MRSLTPHVDIAICVATQAPASAVHYAPQTLPQRTLAPTPGQRTRPRRRVRHLLPRSAFLPAGPLLLQHASQGLPPSALSLLAACLAAEPAARPGAVELAARVEELLKVRATV